MGNNKNTNKLYKVTTGRGDDTATIAVCTDEQEAHVTASTYQRNGSWDVAIKTETILYSVED